jgi:hypothetical protein
VTKSKTSFTIKEKRRLACSVVACLATHLFLFGSDIWIYAASAGVYAWRKGSQPEYIIQAD